MHRGRRRGPAQLPLPPVCPFAYLDRNSSKRLGFRDREFWRATACKEMWQKPCFEPLNQLCCWAIGGNGAEVFRCSFCDCNSKDQNCPEQKIQSLARQQQEIHRGREQNEG